MRTGHGDVWGANMFPDESLLTESIAYAGRQVRYGTLPTQPTENETTVNWSPVCRAPGELMTPDVISKTNILRGFGCTF